MFKSEGLSAFLKMASEHAMRQKDEGFYYDEMKEEEKKVWTKYRVEFGTTGGKKGCLYWRYRRRIA